MLLQRNIYYVNIPSRKQKRRVTGKAGKIELINPKSLRVY